MEAKKNILILFLAHIEEAALIAQPRLENSTDKVMCAALAMILPIQKVLCYEGIKYENFKGTRTLTSETDYTPSYKSKLF